jgi:protein phosphatase
MTNNEEVETAENLLHVWPHGEEAELSSRVRVDWAARSHLGLVRTNNEDHFVVGRFGREMETLATNLPAGAIPARHAEVIWGMLVADGVGGSAAGEIASQTAAATLVDLVIGTPDWIMRLNDDFKRRVQRRLELRLQWVDQLISQQARDIPSLRSMGTTMTVAASIGRDLVFGHVGDSRAYLLHQGELRQLTHDHTWPQMLADTGVIEPGEIKTHPKRHVLTRALGMEDGLIAADVDIVRLADGDQILLCTDGLTDVVDDSAIAEVLGSAGSAEDACNTLINLALKAGGPDNVTTVLFRYHIPEEK